MSKEEEILEWLESDIRKLAKNWSRDRPDAWEDLAQEARLGIFQELREKPDSPHTHLFRRAKQEILDYRKRGKSVDGKLDKTYKRQFVWDLASLDADPTYILGQTSSRYPRPWNQNPVEELAIANVSYSELRSKLSAAEDRYLSLKLQGYTKTEARTLLGLNRHQENRLVDSLREKAKEVLGLDGYHTGSGCSL